IGRRDLPEAEGVVHDGREEVSGLDEGYILGQSVYPRIAQMFDAHQEIRVIDQRKIVEDLVQVPWTDLCGSARRLGMFRQSDKVF
ncbi:MAG: hypothetical protein JSW70_07285, partial [Syntrophobacterales bacterium]